MSIIDLEQEQPVLGRYAMQLYAWEVGDQLSPGAAKNYTAAVPGGVEMGALSVDHFFQGPVGNYH
jgi:hypothetical protein